MFYQIFFIVIFKIDFREQFIHLLHHLFGNNCILFDIQSLLKFDYFLLHHFAESAIHRNKFTCKLIRNWRGGPTLTILNFFAFLQC